MCVCVCVCDSADALSDSLTPVNVEYSTIYTQDGRQDTGNERQQQQQHRQQSVGESVEGEQGRGDEWWVTSDDSEMASLHLKQNGRSSAVEMDSEALKRSRRAASLKAQSMPRRLPSDDPMLHHMVWFFYSYQNKKPQIYVIVDHCHTLFSTSS